MFYNRTFTSGDYSLGGADTEGSDGKNWTYRQQAPTFSNDPDTPNLK
jgi:hypothetical protein